MASTEETKTAQVRIQLTTRYPDIELPDDPGPLLVSTGFRRYALSTLVNNLLQTERPVPFEFLINGQFLRTSIDEFLTANGISAETTLTVEYVRALIPPLHVSSYEHDDWISSVDVLSGSSPAVREAEEVSSGQERILSGGYDGLFRMWNMSNEVIATSNAPDEGGHTLAIKSVKFISPQKIASSSMDRTIRVWDYSEESATLTPTLELYGHKSSVDSIAVHSQSSRILSSSSDRSVGLWTTKKSEAPSAPENLIPKARNKRRKLSHPTPSKTGTQRGPLSLLTGHTDVVSSAIFSPTDHTVGYSASWDHTIRTWDLTTSACVDTRTTAHPLLSLAAMNGANLLAAGTSARHITMIDPRASATTIAAMTLRGHTNGVVSLAADPDSPYGLVSGSHDGTCRVWDIRSVRPGVGEVGGGQVGESVYVIPREILKEKGKSKAPVGGEGLKVFGVCWDKHVGIVSVGEDKRVQVNKAGDIIRT
ncbi:putative microtubule associated protein [Rhizodiscina lignyota]|uniref:Ribosome biogenesis protein YTM1 n=1 Tax=Rhizodiscina lignyota TaxID=1504668 RepID=A0A9P4IC82_9PEZI|nr:putative microtubule associated protein [Rhizodiscina lignyota]